MVSAYRSSQPVVFFEDAVGDLLQNIGVGDDDDDDVVVVVVALGKPAGDPGLVRYTVG